MVVLTKNNEIPDFILYAMGLKDPNQFQSHIKAVMNEEEIEDYGQTEWSLDEVMNKKFKMILPFENYQYDAKTGKVANIAETDTGMDLLYTSDDIGTEIKIVGFIRPKEDVKNAMISSYMAYTAELTQYAINKTNESELVKAQLADEENDLLTGTKFMTEDYKEPTVDEKAEEAKVYIKAADEKEKSEIYRFIMSQPDAKQLDAQVAAMMADFDREAFVEQIKATYAAEIGVSGEQVESYAASMSEEDMKKFAEEAMRAQFTEQYAAQIQAQLSALTDKELSKALSKEKFTNDQYALIFDEFTPEEISKNSHEEIMKMLGKADLEDPSIIRIFADTFEDKDDISALIKDYNKGKDEKDVIHYTDVVALLMSSITSIISGIAYLLIAFVGISLVVSSIMIGIITYISVLERTREIGILRAIGASKHDISTVFNAETLLVGLTAGLIGIGATLLINIPINLIIHSLTSLDTLNATLPPVAAVILVGISMFLTFIAGLIPSGVAARKDPVEALRTE